MTDESHRKVLEMAAELLSEISHEEVKPEMINADLASKLREECIDETAGYFKISSLIVSWELEYNHVPTFNLPEINR